MKIKVDEANDALYFRLNESAIVESEEVQPGVILDFEMATPGDVVFRRLREWRAHLPIVFYTKYALSPDRRIIMEGLGAKDNHIIPKKEIGFAEVDCILAGLESQR